MKKILFTNGLVSFVRILMFSSLTLSLFIGIASPVSAAGSRVPLPTSISGTINDADGNPITGVAIQVRAVLKYDGSQAALTNTDPADGTYTLTDLTLDTAFAVVAGDEDPDVDGYYGRYFNNVSDPAWAESIVLTSGSPDRTGVDINLSNGSVNAEHLTFNTRLGFILNDAKIRQAIAYGTDRQTILDNAFEPGGETGEILNAMVMPGLWYTAASSDPLLTVYNYDPVEARSILTAAGWTDTDADDIRENASDEELALDFVTTNAPIRVASADLFKTQMADIGILVNVYTYPAGDFFSSDPLVSPLASGDFDIAEFAWGLGDDDVLVGMYNTGDIQNCGGYSNATLDGYYNAARDAKVAGEPAIFEEQALLWQYEFSEDLPALPLFTRHAVSFTGTISGTINDAAGNPITGVPIQVRAVYKSVGSKAASTTTNPADGTYTLTSLPLGIPLAVVASDEDPDTDGYPGKYYNNVGNYIWAENILLTIGSPDRPHVDINLSNGSVIAEHLTFNTRLGFILNDADIRQAIAFGTDRQAILDNAFAPNGETGEILHSLVMPGLWYTAASTDPLLTVYQYDPKEAMRILEEAGWADIDADDIRENASDEELVLDFITMNTAARIASANLFKTQMAYIGILVNVSTYSWDDLWGMVTAGSFDIAEFAWVLGDDDSLIGVFTTGNEQNYGDYSNAILDGYFDAAHAAKEAGQSAIFYENALAWQYESAKDLPALPMFTRVPLPPVPASISGTIKDADGNPITGGSVQVRAVLKSDGNPVALTYTNPADGTYTLTSLPLYTALAVVASDEVPDLDGYPGRYFNNVGDPAWAESITLTHGSPDRTAVDIKLSNGSVIAEHLTFNTRLGRILNDVNVRLAIAYGTDRQSILDDAFVPNGVTGEILHSMVMPGLWYKAANDDPLLAVYNFDPTTASGFLAAAGWIDDDADGIRENASDEELVLDFITMNTAPRIASADLFKTQMADIGILVNVSALPSTSLWSLVTAGDFDITEFAWVLGDDDALISVFQTGNEQNYGGYSNATLDGYYNAARAAKVAGESPDFHHGALLWQYESSADLPVLPLFTRINIPPVPANVQASDGTYADKVQVTWDASSGASFYRLYRAAVGAGLDLLDSPTGTAYDDITATPGVSYTYWVKACVSVVVCSDYSASDTGWRLHSPPVNVQASDGTYTNKVRVTWDAYAGATSYKVYRAGSATGGKSFVSAPLDPAFEDSTATPGVTYTYWVTVCIGANCSDYSASDTGWRKLLPPTNVQATDGTYSDKVRVSWTASLGATSYKVYRATTATGTKVYRGLATGAYFDDTTPTPGITYYYWVVAYRSASYSDISTYNTGWRKLLPPTNVLATDGTYTDKVRVTWTASLGATSYKVYRATTATGTKVYRGLATGAYFDDTTPTPGITYYYWVVAYRSASYSAYSSYNTGWRKLLPPTNVQASDGTYTDKVRVTWTASVGATSYKVYRAATATGTKVYRGLATGTYFDDTTATPGVTYYYWVVAYRGASYSAYSTYNSGWRR